MGLCRPSTRSPVETHPRVCPLSAGWPHFPLPPPLPPILLSPSNVWASYGGAPKDQFRWESIFNGKRIFSKVLSPSAPSKPFCNEFV